MSALSEEKLRTWYCNLLDKPVSPQTLKETIEEYTNGSLTEARYKFEFCIFVALFLGHAVITQGQAEDYYFYKGPNGELVISNKQPTPGSKS